MCVCVVVVAGVLWVCGVGVVMDGCLLCCACEDLACEAALCGAACFAALLGVVLAWLNGSLCVVWAWYRCYLSDGTGYLA